MHYTKEERLSIGEQIYNNKISKYEASEIYHIGIDTARAYMRLYRDANGLPPKNKPFSVSKINTMAAADSVDYQTMTKEELLKELIMARIREARLKKGYEVKGDGAEKEIIIYDNRNTK